MFNGAFSSFQRMPEGTKRATSAPVEGPAYGLDFARHCEFPLQALQAQKWYVHRSCMFAAAWLMHVSFDPL